MKLKTLLSVLLAFVLVFSLAACGNGDGGTTTTTTTAAGGDDTDDTTAPDGDDDYDISEFVTISHLSLGERPDSGQYEVVKEEWDAYLKDIVNAELEILYIGWTDYLTNYNLMLATGEGLDLIHTSSSWLDMWPNAQRGAFMDIAELLPVYAPQTWSEVPDEHWEEVKMGDQIIAIPENDYTQWVNHGYMYRGDWADDFGVGDVEDWEDLGNYLQAVKDNLGDQGVVPFDVSGTSNMIAIYDTYVEANSSLIRIDSVPGGLAYAVSIDDWTDVVSRYYVQPDGRDILSEFAVMMKDWGDAGYWREDVLNNTADGWAQFKAGLNGIRQHHTNTYIYAKGEVARDMDGVELRYMPNAFVSGNLVKQSITHGATSVAANCPNPERALMIYDLIRNDETMYRLFNWGIEGVQYEITDEGLRRQPEGYDAQRDGFHSNFWGGRVDKFELKYPNAQMMEGWEELYAQLDEVAVEYPYGRFVFDRTPVDGEISAVTEVIDTNLPAISTGKAGDPEEAVARFRSQLELAGYDRILEEVESQMEAWLATIQ